LIGSFRRRAGFASFSAGKDARWCDEAVLRGGAENDRQSVILTSESNSTLLLAAFAAIVSAASLFLLLKFAHALPHGIPGPRSLHQRPTPRVGGLAIWAAMLPVAIIAPPAVPGRWPIWLFAWLVVVGVSLADDWRGVSPIYRLGVQLLAATAIAAPLTNPVAGPVGAFGTAAAVLAVVWASNLFNFMDGSDGVAATMGVCGFAAYGLAAFLAGTASAFYVALAAATLVFLFANLPPARIFMGDVGAVPMGFLAAGLGLAGWRLDFWPGWFPVLVFLPFIADATMTLAKRLLRRERVWEAHREHYYQRLHQLGAGHAGTLVFFGVLMVGTGTSALVTLAIDATIGWGVTLAWVIALGALFRGIDYHWRHRNAS
jgi:UDP-N-acetylmuramyl pentapeptide phosphotransferase/UDP-N-acetylglucosamine-1-phosphate transferase